MKQIIIYFMALVAAVSAAGRTPADFFTAPGADGVFPELTQNSRMDMMDYFKAGQVREVSNYYEGKSRLLRADSVAVSVAVGTGARVDLFVISDGADTTLMVVETLELPQKDSAISFYNADWQPVRRTLLPRYVMADWLTRAGEGNRAEVERRIPFILAVATYDPVGKLLRLFNTLEEYFPAEGDKAFLAENIRKALVYRWNKGKFSLEK